MGDTAAMRMHVCGRPDDDVYVCWETSERCTCMCEGDPTTPHECVGPHNDVYVCWQTPQRCSCMCEGDPMTMYIYAGRPQNNLVIYMFEAAPTTPHKCMGPHNDVHV